MRSNCVACGGFLQGRAFPAGRWGTWCPRCNAWWPDGADGARADDSLPPELALRDMPTRVEPYRAPDAPQPRL